MTTGELSIAILHPAVTIAMAAVAVRLQYPAQATERLSGSARIAIGTIVLCAAVIVLAGARWWLMPSWPGMGTWSAGAAAVMVVLVIAGRAPIVNRRAASLPGAPN